MTVTDDFPEGHASLTDGSTKIKFIFTDGQGKKNERAFQAQPYPRTALKTTQGESKYSDLEQPYFAIPQDDWTGGRGNEDFEADTSRYFDGHFVDTSKESGVILGGRETYSTGYHNQDQVLPGSMTFYGAYVATRYLAVSFTGSASYTSYQCEIWVKKIGSPGDLQVELWDNAGGSPDSMLASKTLTAANITTDVISLFKDFVWTGSPGISAVTLWVVIDGGSTATATNHWAIGCGSTAGKKSADASTWTATATYSPYYRITPAKADFVGRFFEYKSALYVVTQPNSGGNSALYINGDRGAADSNVGDKTNLEDSSKSWTTDEWAGDKVLIIKGPGSDEEQPWRLISSNDSNSLVCSLDWNVTHTTSTEYVILGSDKWTQLDADLGAYMTDVAIAGEYIWMARGGDNSNSGIYRRRFYNLGGTWTDDEEVTSNILKSDKILNVNHPDEGEILYSTTTNHVMNGVSIYKGKVPRDKISIDDWLYYPVYEFETDIAWLDKIIANVTQQTDSLGFTQIGIGASHTTGLAAVLNIDPLDLRQGKELVAEVRSTKNLDAGDYEWIYDDVEDMGKTWSPVKVFKADYAYSRPPSKVYFVVDYDGATPTYTALPKVIDQIGGTVETVSITVDDLICVGYSIPFNSFSVDLGGTVNAVADRTLTAYYTNGDGETSLSATDGTKTADNGTTKTLAQDGNVTWTIPEDWVVSTIDGVEAYWVVCVFSGDLTPSIVINDINITVSEAATMTELYDDLTNAYDGDSATDTNLTLGTEDYLWIGYGTKFNKITVDVATANDIASVLTAAYYNGSVMTAVTITDGTKANGDTLKQDGDITFTIPNDWEANTVNSTETYWIRLDVSNALSTTFSINEITVTRQNNKKVSIPALVANEWTTVMVPIAGFTTPIPDLSSVKSIGLNVKNDKTDVSFSIRKLWLANPFVDSMDETSFRMPSEKRINGLQAYAGNVDDPIKNPWIFTTDAVYEMQTQNDDQIVDIPLEELGSLQSSENGLGHTVNGTYLYFNVGEKIERYFNRTLDDIGPDRDEGLPDDRPGIPKSLASYPGRVYAGIDATTGTSSALALDGTAWHEVYRAPQTNRQIRSIFVQAIPGTNVDRLWISKGSDILWLPISLNPYNETDFTFQHEGHLITSYIYANLLDVVKLWKSLKVFAENVTSTRNIIADYQVDTDTTWTEIGTFDTAPVEEIDLASTLPQAKRIRYRLRFVSDDVSESPRLKAIVTEGVAFVPVKYQYSWTFAIKKDTENVDLVGGFDDSMTSLVQYNQLVTWANAGTPLTLEHHSTLYDNKTVFLDPVAVSPIKVVDNQDVENHVASLTCIEV